MGRIPEDEEALLNRYAEAVARRVRANAVVLFGSRARGDALRDSDYDLAVVSPDFGGLSVHARWRRLDGAWEEPRAVEEVCLTPEELAGLGGLLVCDIVDEGIPIRDDGTFAAAREKLEGEKQAGRRRRTPSAWAFPTA
ncbi:MAG: nucleotidyltransferase domain-containing protein [Planctomycetota bacterium]